MVFQVVGDESGSDGENLSRPTHRTFSYGTTNLTTSEAAELVVRTRESIGSTGVEARSGAELKWPQLYRKHRKVAEDLFERNGPLTGRACIYLVDKIKFLAGKMVSLLIEEHQLLSPEPVPFWMESFLADEITDHVLPVLAEDVREQLLQAFNGLCRSYKTPYAPAHRADAFIQALRLASLSGSHDPRASRMLGRLWVARHESHTIEADTADTRDLEPMLPTLLIVATTWNRILGGQEFEIHMDEYRQMTPYMLEIVKATAGQFFSVPLLDIVQVTSADDPRVQIADWIAGAGRVAANDIMLGHPNRLSHLVQPFIDPESMRSPDSPLEKWIIGN